MNDTAQDSTPNDLPAPPVAREGWPIIAIFLFVAAGATALARMASPTVALLVGFVGLVLCGWCVWFFRDPPRRVPRNERFVVSPADGRISMIGPARLPSELKEGDVEMVRVCVFMNVFNVHVNRAPVGGQVEKIQYSAGRFFNAALDKASTENERMSMVLRMADGRKVVAVQIAGLIARRIVCRVKAGISLLTGERYGLIRFGSRVDVYMPAGSVVRVKLGETVTAGETVLAELPPSGPASEGAA